MATDLRSVTIAGGDAWHSALCRLRGTPARCYTVPSVETLGFLMLSRSARQRVLAGLPPSEKQGHSTSLKAGSPTPMGIVFSVFAQDDDPKEFTPEEELGLAGVSLTCCENAVS